MSIRIENGKNFLHCPWYNNNSLDYHANQTKNNGYMNGHDCTDEYHLGAPTKMRTSLMNILLVFNRDDAQCETFKKAAEHGSYSCSVALSMESARQRYSDSHHDLVVIDSRHSKSIDKKSIDSEGLCRSLRSLAPKSHSVFLAVINKTGDKDEPSILPLLQAGFTRRFTESLNEGSCLNELLSIEKGELRQLQTRSAMLLALQNVSESIEITDSRHKTEFVNSSFENVTGYNTHDVIGNEMQDKFQIDNCNEEDTIVYHMKKGEPWDGLQSLRKKNGDTIHCRCKILPLLSSQGRVARHIVMRTPRDHDSKLNDTRRGYRRGSYFSLSSSTEGLMHIRRKESITRIQSMTVEAPITKVINILYETQQATPNGNVIQALDRVLEILQTTDLYASHIEQVKEEDPLLNDLVGGLVVGDSGKLSYPRSSAIKISSVLRSPPIDAVSQGVKELLENDNLWTFDIIQLERINNKNVLLPLGMKIFRRFDACEHLNIDEQTLASWLQLIGSKYRSANPYHNATHAADVLQATAFFLDKMRPKKIFDSLDEVSALIAAVIHDVDHPARTSAFLVNSRSELAVLYNDVAVLENHHAALGFFLTHQDDKSNILKNLDRNEYEDMRHTIIDMVLATELAKHFEHLQKFLVICKAYTKNLDDDTSIKSGMTSISDLVITSRENKRQILRMAIKCADVSNPARNLNLCKEWAKRIAEEYFDQTDEEREKNLPVMMPNFDRSTCSIPHSQIKFMEIFLMNMFESWDSFLAIDEVQQQLMSNYEYWKSQDVEPSPSS